ncbi:MAG: ATP-binding protein [Acidimicrobiales bacterium]
MTDLLSDHSTPPLERRGASGAFPFDAVVGQDEAKLALRLAARDPLLGGVLLRGQKGSAKTTLARGLADLLGGAPFVDLPLGATEDRVVGTLDTRAALTGGELRFEAGLLAAADGGVLYVDEINLLPDHLVDVLLDVAASGENVVERDGLSHRHPARFVLIGSMNPEEGELRPQLLDRFGLCVDVAAPLDVAERTEAVRRRLAFDHARPAPSRAESPAGEDPPTVTGPAAGSTEPGSPPPTGVTAELPDPVIGAASRLALAAGAEGLRADLALCRAATAFAELAGRPVVTVDDLRRIASLALSHRSRRRPFDPPVTPRDELDQLVADHLPEPTSDDEPPAGPDGPPSDHLPEPTSDDEQPVGPDGPPPHGGPGDERPADRERGHDEQSGAGRGAAPDRPLLLGTPRNPPLPVTGRGHGPRGRVVGDAPAAGTGPVAVLPTVRASVHRRRTGTGGRVEAADLRSVVRDAPRSRVVVLCIDLSGSMGAPERARAASGTVLGLLADAYVRRDRVALVTFRADGATTVLAPTSSVEVARNRLDHLATGGSTPLASGLAEALRLALRSVDDHTDSVIAVLTDGRATGSGGIDAAVAMAAAIRRSPVSAVVLDCETGPHPLGLAAELAEVMGAPHVRVDALEPDQLVAAVRAVPTRAR